MSDEKELSIEDIMDLVTISPVICGTTKGLALRADLEPSVVPSEKTPEAFVEIAASNSWHQKH